LYDFYYLRPRLIPLSLLEIRIGLTFRYHLRNRSMPTQQHDKPYDETIAQHNGINTFKATKFVLNDMVMLAKVPLGQIKL
jgi:hypothetical protein